jgi:hypothetical protein
VGREQPGRATQERSGEGEDSVAVEDGKHYDVEMDCATIADGKLDECIKLPGKQFEMSGILSIVRTDPFTSPTADHQRQRPAIHRQGLQGVYPALADQPCVDQSALPAIQRQAGTLPPDLEGTGHPTQNTAITGPSPRSGPDLC